jgi:hypothetical protein
VNGDSGRAAGQGHGPLCLNGGHPLVEFGHGRLDLLLADRVGGVLELAAQLGASETQRLAGAELFGVYTGGKAAAALLMLACVELFLQSGFGIYEPFTSVTHSGLSSLSGRMASGQRERIIEKQGEKGG